MNAGNKNSTLHNPADQTDLRSFGRLVRRWLIPLLASVVVVLTGFFCFKRVQDEIAKNLASKLTTILDTAVQSLRFWANEQQRNLDFIAAQPQFLAAVEQLTQYSLQGATAQQLLEVPTQAMLRKLFEDARISFGYEEFSVIDRTGRIVSDGFTHFVGQSQRLLEHSELKNSAVLRDDRQLLVFPRQHSESTGPSDDLMYILGPIKNDAGVVIAAVAFGMRPESKFTDILSVARPGASGETIAFDANGCMLSDSRFDLNLQNGEQLPAVSHPDRNLKLRAPSRVLRSYDPKRDNDTGNPLTTLVAAVVNAASRNVSAVQINTHGFVDYRGERSVGAGRWLSDYNFGVVTRIDYDEAYAPYLTLRNTVLILCGLAFAGVIGNVLYTRMLSEAQLRAQRAEQRARYLGQYRLDEKIGEGGMGEVYRATHAMLRRPTAVKLMRPEHSGETAIAKFEREVQFTAALSHPNTIAIYDYGRTVDDVFYYAMEYLDGPDLSKVIAQCGPMGSGRVIYILLQMCGSLCEAHEAGLIHRDIKPANVILCSRGGSADVVKLLDFGLVSNVSERSRYNKSRIIDGTPAFMSPESVNSPGAVDVRSDLYGIGAVGYFLLTGRNTFQGDSAAEIWHQQCEKPPPPPEEITGHVIDTDLSRIIMQCLSICPDDRPVSATQLAAELERCSSAGSWGSEEAKSWWHQFRKSDDLERSSPHPIEQLAPTVIVGSDHFSEA